MLHLTVPVDNQRERGYVLDVLLRRWLGLEFAVQVQSGTTVTTMSLDGQSSELVLQESVLLGDLDSAKRLPVTESDGWTEVGAGAPDALLIGSRLPVLYGEVPPTASRLTPGGATIDVDILGTTFALLTGLEDRFITERDGHGRVPLTSTLLHRKNLVEHPVVDELTELLWAAMSALWPGLTRRSADAGVRITQDVDRMGKFGRATIGDLALSTAAGMRRGGPSEALRTLFGGAKVRVKGRQHDPYYTFNRFMDVVERHGHTASFYFICRYGRTDGTRLGHYNLQDPVVLELLSRICDRGHELGVHPGYDSHRDVEALKADTSALRSAASLVGIELAEIGGRHHYLRWDTHNSPGCWQAAGLAHDSSIGFAESIGFRAGTSKSFPLWDHQRREVTTVEEHPLIYMDATLAIMNMTFDDKQTVERLLRLKQRCHQYGGDFTFLVHNEDFAAPGAEPLLEALLK